MLVFLLISIGGIQAQNYIYSEPFMSDMNYELLFGNLSVIKNITDENETTTEDKGKDLITSFESELMVLKQMDQDEGDYNASFDMIEYKKANQNLRKFYAWWWATSYEDQQDRNSKWTNYQSRSMEWIKKLLANRLGLAWLVHARHQIRQAIQAKAIIVNDRRYRIGYLFNRVRRLMYEQRKLTSEASTLRFAIWYRSTMFLYSYRAHMRVIQKMTRVDIDVRDTERDIKRLINLQGGHRLPENFF